MNTTKYINKGLSGLTNNGNTCFINTCMQILSHTYPLNDILDKKSRPEIEQKSQININAFLLHEWNKLRNILWSQNCIVNPGAWIKAIHITAIKKDRDIFTGFMQNDINEFLLFIIDCFHISLKRNVSMKIQGEAKNHKDKVAIECFNMIKKMYEKDYSELFNLFYGIHISEIFSTENGKIMGLTPEPYFIIELPIATMNNETGSEDLYTCFEKYTSNELLKGDNQWYNEKTKKRENAYKRIKFWNFPDILVISLKRFNNNNRKINKLIDFPLNNLDLCKYVDGYNKKSYVYDLYAVANHTGNAFGGHYFAYIKNAKKWYMFNDTQVSEIRESNIVSQKAYILFYIKKNIY